MDRKGKERGGGWVTKVHCEPCVDSSSYTGICVVAFSSVLLKGEPVEVFGA